MKAKRIALYLVMVVAVVATVSGCHRRFGHDKYPERVIEHIDDHVEDLNLSAKQNTLYGELLEPGQVNDEIVGNLGIAGDRVPLLDEFLRQGRRLLGTKFPRSYLNDALTARAVPAARRLDRKTGCLGRIENGRAGRDFDCCVERQERYGERFILISRGHRRHRYVRLTLLTNDGMSDAS